MAPRVGVLPGAGADIGAWVAYATSKKTSKTPEKFGTGHLEGLVDAGAANNAGLSGAWVPAIVFGIPGDSITAIVIGVLYMKGMNPGPTVFLNDPHLIYAVFIVFILANLALLPLGYALIKLSEHILRVPRHVLMPIILMFCIVGSFAINNTGFGVVIMLVLGLMAYVMEENGFPVAPANTRDRAGSVARRQLHDLDDQGRRGSVGLRVPTDRRRARLRHPVHLGDTATCSTGTRFCRSNRL